MSLRCPVDSSFFRSIGGLNNETILQFVASSFRLFPILTCFVSLAGRILS